MAHGLVREATHGIWPIPRPATLALGRLALGQQALRQQGPRPLGREQHRRELEQRRQQGTGAEGSEQIEAHGGSRRRRRGRSPEGSGLLQSLQHRRRGPWREPEDLQPGAPAPLQVSPVLICPPACGRLAPGHTCALRCTPCGSCCHPCA
jgi:hypothetical protein